MIRLGLSKIANEGFPAIREDDLYRHVIVIGGTGRGKTTYLANLLTHIKAGCIILDPYGDLARGSDPDIYVTKDTPISLNPFSRPLNESEHANELVEVINTATRVVNPEQMEITVLMAQILRKAIPRVKDVVGLANLLNNPKSFWSGVDREQSLSAKRIQARLSLLTDDENLRPFMTGKGIDYTEIAQKRLRVAFNLGRMDDFVTAFLGGLIANGVKSYYLHEATRESPPLFLVIDEFRMFFSRLFHRFLAECRKYNIGVILAGHSFSQAGRELTDMILANCHTKVFLGGNNEDLKAMGRYYVALGKHEGVVFIGDNPHHIKCFPPPKYTPVEEANFWRDNEWINYAKI